MFKGKLEFELEFPFYFTYHPPVIDERVKNQSSIFVFQPFSTNTHYFEGVPAQMWQKKCQTLQSKFGIQKRLGEN